MAKMSVYDVITQRIVALLEKGEIPWRKPWGQTPAQNGEYKTPYRGINAFLLNAAGYSNPYWLTFRQAQKMGGNVKAGEHGMPVIKWIFPEEAEANADEKKHKRPPYPIYFTVFNVLQCEGLDMGKFADPVAKREHTPLESAEGIVAGMPQKPTVKAGDKAAWVPSTDEIIMPPPEVFRDGESYYRILFHELIHSTGHESRLARREGATHFGSEKYGREELVAEMGAAFLAGAAGIDGSEAMEQSAAYIQNWLKAIKDDPQAVVMAAAQAQKAADWILGRKWEGKKAEVEEVAVG